MRGDELVRMVPYKDGKANRGHSCVKGRFAWGYANHQRAHPQTDDPRQSHRAVARSRRGRKRSVTPPPNSSASRRNTDKDSIGGITSSRCTDEETFLVQKIDPRRRSATTTSIPAPASAIRRPVTAWHRLWHLRRHAGFRLGGGNRRRHADRRQSDRCAPVFASRMKKRLRQGAKLIVIDPRHTEMVRSAAHRGGLSSAAHSRHQRRNSYLAGACRRHREIYVNEKFVRERCDWDEFSTGRTSFRSRATARKRSPRFPACRLRRFAAPRGSTPVAAMVRSITVSASPSTARARPPSWRSPTSRWRPAISAGRASA